VGLVEEARRLGWASKDQGGSSRIRAWGLQALGRGVFGIGRDLQWVHGLDLYTTPSFGCPSKFIKKFHQFSIFLKILVFFFEIFCTSSSRRAL
jgi:hypothetical protein